MLRDPVRPRRRVRTAWFGVGVVLSLLARGGTAHAAPAVDLVWDAPEKEGCPDRDAMIRAVARLVPETSLASLRVEASARERDGQWVVDLEMTGPALGKRTLRASTCASVARAAAFIVAIALDPQAALLASEALEVEPPKRDRAPPPVAPPAREAPTPAPRSPPRALAYAGAVVEHGLLPGFAVGLVVGGGITWRSLRVDLRGEALPAASTSLRAVPSAGADFALLAVASRGCVGVPPVGVSISVCVGVEVARIAAEGRGLSAPYRTSADVASLVPAVLVRFPAAARLGIELDVEGLVPFARPEFVVDVGADRAALHRVAVLGARASLGLGYRF